MIDSEEYKKAMEVLNNDVEQAKKRGFCPLHDPEKTGANCDGKLCAWWDSNVNKCAMLSLANSLGRILDEIGSKG